ncbi:hypothetical protein SK128_015347 [Halocaridina rubra]|uniref:Uncharacterized protein n=1 Tax=Halocaridina rubra TaxID=373956 RepID=A0AAN9ADI2_HALRR
MDAMDGVLNENVPDNLQSQSVRQSPYLFLTWHFSGQVRKGPPIIVGAGQNVVGRNVVLSIGVVSSAVVIGEVVKGYSFPKVYLELISANISRKGSSDSERAMATVLCHG